MPDAKSPSVQTSRAQRAFDVGRLTIRIVRTDSAHVVKLSGELDLATAPHVTDVLGTAEASDAHTVVLDLSRLVFIDSSGLRLIIEADRRLRMNGRQLRLVRGPSQIQRIFEITDTARRLPFIDS